MNEQDKSLNLDVEFNGRSYTIKRDKSGGYLRIIGTRQQFDLSSNYPIAQYVDRYIKINTDGRLGKKILKVAGVSQNSSCQTASNNVE